MLADWRSKGEITIAEWNLSLISALLETQGLRLFLGLRTQQINRRHDLEKACRSARPSRRAGRLRPEVSGDRAIDE
jgi:hypothetical protein